MRVFEFNKLWWALLLAVVLGIQQAAVDGVFSSTDWVTTVGMGLAVIATWAFPNTPIMNTVKAWANALVIGAGVLSPLLLDGWQTNTDLWPTIIAVLQVAGVPLVKNAGTVNGVFPRHIAAVKAA